jgi:hypothetical protein
MAVIINNTITECKQATIYGLAQCLIKKQQPAASGLGVASLTDQNSGLSWAHVNTFYMNEVMSNV